MCVCAAACVSAFGGSSSDLVFQFYDKVKRQLIASLIRDKGRKGGIFFRKKIDF